MAGLDKIVTDELVFSLADRLTAEGRKVSNRVLWDHIGGGSMTTIAGALRRWRERQQIRADVPAERMALPESVGLALRAAVEQLWAAAQQETQREIERVTEAANARVAEAVAERDGALAELQTTVEELQAVQLRLGELQGELQDARREGEEVHAELVRATEQARQAEVRAVEIERRADDLRAELGRVHEEARAERERQAQAIAAGQAALDGVRAELASVQATAQAEERRHAEAAKRAREKAERLAEQLTRAGIERDDARNAAAEARENAARLQGQVEAMKTQQGELMKAIGGKAERATSGRAPKSSAGPTDKLV